MLDVGRWMEEAGCWMLDAVWRMLVPGYLFLHVGRWMLDAEPWSMFIGYFVLVSVAGPSPATTPPASLKLSMPLIDSQHQPLVINQSSINHQSLIIITQHSSVIIGHRISFVGAGWEDVGSMLVVLKVMVCFH